MSEFPLYSTTSLATNDSPTDGLATQKQISKKYCRSETGFELPGVSVGARNLRLLRARASLRLHLTERIHQLVKVISPTKSSTCCLLLLIKIPS
jgi:hypothetical protein